MLGPRAVALRVGALCVIGSVPAFVSPSLCAVAMKREKDNKFIIMNEDEISHAGMFAT